jgi:hypothetical protein
MKNLLFLNKLFYQKFHYLLMTGGQEVYYYIIQMKTQARKN